MRGYKATTHYCFSGRKVTLAVNTILTSLHKKDRYLSVAAEWKEG